MKRMMNPCQGARLVIAGCLLVAMQAWASPQLEPSYATQDPWEAWNRKVFALNKTLDTFVLKPAARWYRTVLPAAVQRTVHRVFSNVSDIPSAVQAFLQGHVRAGLQGVTRVAFNTTLGVGGLWDVSSTLGLHQPKRDFGQTLGVWGLCHSRYVVLPFWGASTLRDAVGTWVDWQLDPVRWIEPPATRYGIRGVNWVDGRAHVLAKEELLSMPVWDEYAWVRDAYLQRRAYTMDQARAQPCRTQEGG